VLKQNSNFIDKFQMSVEDLGCSVTPLSDRIPRLYDAVSHIWWQKSTPGRAFATRCEKRHRTGVGYGRREGSRYNSLNYVGDCVRSRAELYGTLGPD
jgi:hypothetical protein